MNLVPFISVDETPFSASENDVLAARGMPIRMGRNGVGLKELDYDTIIFRFQDCGRLEEITMQAPTVNFGKVVVPFSALSTFIGRQDSEMFDKAGFLVSPTFGLAFDPNCPCWVTALAKHCLEAWRAI
jgi:hypothetical protein